MKPYRIILALTDLSIAGHQAVDRAALLAAHCGAELRLMHAAVPGPLRGLEFAPRLDALARNVAQAAGISVRAVHRPGSSLEEIAAEANGADLLVASDRPACDALSLFRGQWHQRVMRLAHCAVLLTRSSGLRPYAKIVVAVAFDASARQLVQFACEVDDRAELELFHAISRADEAKLRSADVSWEVIRTFRARQEAYARQRLSDLAQSIETGGRPLILSTGSGEAGAQTSLRQVQSGAALTVVGRTQRGALAEFLSGSVSRRVLAGSSADVLIVPHHHRSSSRVAARLRIAADRAEGRAALLSGREAAH